MKGIFYFSCLTIISILGIGFPRSSRGQEEQEQIGCQQRSTLGCDYVGEANTTVDGIPCQRWSDTEPHDHPFTDEGDHNFCRNPGGYSGVWCYTTDPDVEYQYCSVPFCLPSKQEQRQIGCQQRSTSGRDYVGEANTTVDGIYCQRWSDTEPHDHDHCHFNDHHH